MENISYIGLSQQMALHRLLDVTANNMANMNTPGFKSQNILFKEYLNKAGENGEKISQVQDYGTYRDLTQGNITQTHSDLDAALPGEGYFTIKTPDGARYTRNGSFSLNEKGEIVTKAGYTVMSDGGGAIGIQAGASHITIAKNGEVSTELGAIGKLKVVTFGRPGDLSPVGDNMFDAQNAREIPVDKPGVQQGMLEGSNVQPLLEMNKMVEILRMYQAAQNMLVNDHERIRNTIQRLTRV